MNLYNPRPHVFFEIDNRTLSADVLYSALGAGLFDLTSPVTMLQLSVGAATAVASVTVRLMLRRASDSVWVDFGAALVTDTEAGLITAEFVPPGIYNRIAYQVEGIGSTGATVDAASVGRFSAAD